jgi:tetratricopeptide (TPR) repeat protein
MLDKASALFDLNLQNYPKSSVAQNSMGDCYLAQKDSIKALEYFTKALEIEDNSFSQEKIEMLKNDF